MEGYIRKLYRDLQYGFIQTEKGSYFLHKTDYNGHWIALCNAFDEGEHIRIEFQDTMTDKGMRAKEAKLADV